MFYICFCHLEIYLYLDLYNQVYLTSFLACDQNVLTFGSLRRYRECRSKYYVSFEPSLLVREATG